MSSSAVWYASRRAAGDGDGDALGDGDRLALGDSEGLGLRDGDSKKTGSV